MKTDCKCGHSIDQHDFSHSSECRGDTKCKCEYFEPQCFGCQDVYKPPCEIGFECPHRNDCHTRTMENLMELQNG